jgi:hypothetical protein
VVRRSLPHNPGPGLAAGITAGVTAAAVVVVGAIVALATVLTSGGGPQTTSASIAAHKDTIAGTYSLTRHVKVCEPAGDCILGPLPLRITCAPDGSCTASSSHWGQSHPLSFNGTSFSLSGSDNGVAGTCDGAKRIAAMTMNISVISWNKGSGSVETPKELSGPYDVTAPPTGQCAEWHLEATLTYSAPAASASAPSASSSSGTGLNPDGFALPLTAASGSPSLTTACQWQYPSDPDAVAEQVPGSSTVAAYTVQCVDGSDNLGGLDLTGYCGSLVSGMVATNPDSAGPATDQPPPWDRWECVPG